MTKKIISLVMVIQISILPFLIIPMASPSVSGQFLEPTVELSFLEYQKRAEYSGDYAEATFNGLANVTIVPGTRVVVAFTASDTWGSAVVSPSSLLFAENGQQSFSVNVRVPPREEYLSEGQVTLNGQWCMYPGTITGNCDPVTGTIIVGQYFNFSLSSEQDKLDAPENSGTKLELTITNTGNKIDTFSVNLKNQEKLYEQGFQIELSPTNIEIPNGFSETVTITVKTPSKRNALIENQIIIEVYSDLGIQHEVEPKDFLFEIKLTEKDSTIPEGLSWGIIIIFIIIIIIILSWRYKKKKQIY